MDKETRSGGSSLSTNGVFAVLVLAAGALVWHEAPLQGTRPASNEPKVEQRFAEQDIDARLWQDPFGAVERARDESSKKVDPKVEAARRSPASLKAVILEKGSEGPGPHVDEVDVLAVMVPGGPYAEQVERRRRARYAVLAGLNASGYAPVDTEHIGYFAPAGNEKLPHELPRRVPYEWFEPEPDQPDTQCPSRDRKAATDSACTLRHVLVLWLDSAAFTERPFERIKKLLGQLNTEKPKPALRWRVLGPPESGGLRAMVEESSLSSFDPGFFQDCDVRFYSPWATVPDDILVERVVAKIAPKAAEPARVARPCGRDPGDPAAAASAEPANGEASLARHFGERGISFVRTIGDDVALVDSLKKELGLRLLVKPPPSGSTGACNGPDSPPHIAVITELDTLYGRSLRRQFKPPDRNGPSEGLDQTGFCIKRFQYVRGLDGQLPDRGSQTSTAPPKDASAAKSGAKDKNDSLLIERAEGQSQFDYLRRLAARLREKDRELREASAGKGGIQAIGVLGNDVHDKLLVLQALKPEFPDAVFFTTDLDVRFLHPREQEWTRNLIVASHFGLRLTDRLQSSAPPFRDSYQTSTFFSTSLAIAEINNIPDFRWTQSQVNQSLQAPRMFELGRTAAFDFSPAPKAAEEKNDDKNPAKAPAPLARLTSLIIPQANAAVPPDLMAKSLRCDNDTFIRCTNVHPRASSAYPHVNLPAALMISTLFVALLWVPALALSRPTRRRLRRFVAHDSGWRRRGGLLVLLIAVQVALPLAMANTWPDFARMLTDGGKPIDFSEGISIWPTEAIRLLTLLLCIYLAFRGWSALARNLDDITLRLRLGKTRRSLVAEQDLQDQGLAWWQKVANMFLLRRPYVGSLPITSGPDTDMSPATLAFWKHYIVQNRNSSRIVRSVACVALMALLGVALFAAIDESPGVPVRGNVSHYVHLILGGALFAAMNFLVFYVADATLLCVRFVRELRRRSISWPERSRRMFQLRMGGLPLPLIDHWIDLQFIARRTRCVTGLVYYPFIVLSLQLLSRSEVFDNWRMPLAMQVMSMVSIGIVLVCIVALRKVAENSRSRALVEVKEAQLRAQARDAQGPPAPQQLDLLRRQIEELHDGAFAPFAQQPLMRAMLMPFATWGGTVMLDYMSMASI